MSNVQFYLDAIKQQTEAVERLNFKQAINEGFTRGGRRLNQEEVELAWQEWKKQHN